MPQPPASLTCLRPSRSTMLISLASLALLASTAAALPPSKAPKGFVTTSGTKFKLDGKDFYFAGSNAYVRILATSRKTTGANKSPQYFPFNNNQADVEAGLTAAKKAGLDVFRTWGFNDKNATYNPTVWRRGSRRHRSRLPALGGREVDDRRPSLRQSRQRGDESRRQADRRADEQLGRLWGYGCLYCELGWEISR
jgi:hypothetical protein